MEAPTPTEGGQQVRTTYNLPLFPKVQILLSLLCDPGTITFPL
jgi:hypothetical protein